MAEPMYMDHAATTPVRREVLEAMFPYFQRSFGNPSSVHSVGHEAAEALRAARERVAEVLGALPEEIVFTSGGTESDNLAVIGTAEARRADGPHVVISAIEHEAVLQSATELERRGFSVSRASVDARGLIDPDTVAGLVREDTVLVSCMYANNEIGTVEPVGAIAGAARDRNPGVLVHTDAVQAAGHLSLDVENLGVDLLSLSGHKIYGPRGIGVLYVRRGVRPRPLIHGGGQEFGLRSGTENVAACVGMAEALVLAEGERPAESARLAALRDRLIDSLRALGPSIVLTGHPSERLAGHASFALLDRTAESVLVDLDARGIQCSSGSACHAGQTDPSHVLLALGYDDVSARNGLRFTLGRDSTEADVVAVVAAMGEILRPAAALTAGAT